MMLIKILLISKSELQANNNFIQVNLQSRLKKRKRRWICVDNREFALKGFGEIYFTAYRENNL